MAEDNQQSLNDLIAQWNTATAAIFGNEPPEIVEISWHEKVATFSVQAIGSAIYALLFIPMILMMGIYCGVRRVINFIGWYIENA